MRSRRTESPRPSAQRSAKLAKKILRYCELIDRLDAMPTNAVWEARNAIQNVHYRPTTPRQLFAKCKARRKSQVEALWHLILPTEFIARMFRLP